MSTVTNILPTSARLARIKPSASGSARERVMQLMREGHTILDLSIGEPDLDTPDHVKAAAIEAITRGDTKYTGAAGTHALREAVVEKYRRENGVTIDASQVFIGSGAKQVLHNAFAATLNAGDEVVVPAPYWVSYPDMVALSDGVPVIAPASAARDYKLTASELDRAITPRTRWVVLNSPNNPTGASYSERELRELADVILSHERVWLLSDDIYEHFHYGKGKALTPLEVVPELAERSLSVNGVSKTYAMTGWRIGYGVGPASLIRQLVTLQSQTLSCVSSISQAAATAALNGPQDFVEHCVATFRERLDAAMHILGTVELLDCVRPSGAFYIFPGCARVIGKTTPDGKRIGSDVDFAAYLLDHAKVAVLDGSAYGVSPSIRLSFATALDTVKEACHRIKSACEALK
ncbi:aminotransferase class I/II-fold pyridoxal phosphate-dependent enzyme [Paraburkholderia oxyphila]|uniref:aminotransferase class I/II-fold pyridoxal phosphate-dependent enzyme n=1 Tax=Paraburkholderia oxyphila TaxID=614212 RepID=UPI0005B7C6AD|nr:aminotransferase class I/II-fold pyridoxal phosphate-dependent enzyme [Paraburkholderia oxyphila]